MRTHSAFINNPTIDDFTGLIGLEEFWDFFIILSLYEWWVNYPEIPMNSALHWTHRNILKSNYIYLDQNAQEKMLTKQTSFQQVGTALVSFMY